MKMTSNLSKRARAMLDYEDNRMIPPSGGVLSAEEFDSSKNTDVRLVSFHGLYNLIQMFLQAYMTMEACTMEHVNLFNVYMTCTETSMP